MESWTGLSPLSLNCVSMGGSRILDLGVENLEEGGSGGMASRADGEPEFVSL